MIPLVAVPRRRERRSEAPEESPSGGWRYVAAKLHVVAGTAANSWGGER